MALSVMIQCWEGSCGRVRAGENIADWKGVQLGQLGDDKRQMRVFMQMVSQHFDLSQVVKKTDAVL